MQGSCSGYVTCCLVKDSVCSLGTALLLRALTMFLQAAHTARIGEGMRIGQDNTEGYYNSVNTKDSQECKLRCANVTCSNRVDLCRMDWQLRWTTWSVCSLPPFHTSIRNAVTDGSERGPRPAGVVLYNVGGRYLLTWGTTHSLLLVRVPPGWSFRLQIMHPESWALIGFDDGTSPKEDTRFGVTSGRVVSQMGSGLTTSHRDATGKRRPPRKRTAAGADGYLG